MRGPLLIALLALVLSSSPICAAAAPVLRLVVEPQQSLLDQPVSIRVQGNAGAIVSLTLTTQRFGMPFASQATFVVPPNGMLDTAQDAPRSGSYSGAHAMGLFWSVLPRSDNEQSHAEPQRDADVQPRSYTIEATQGAQTARAVVTRLAVAPDVQRSVVDSGSFVGTLFAPRSGCRPGVIVLGGSEGGIPEEQAAALAGDGFTTLALGYFGAPGLPATLENIPLETVERGVAFLRANAAACRQQRIAVVGWSKGAELALLSAATFPQIRAVVAIAPASVVFSGIGAGSGPIASSWTYRNTPLPFVNGEVPQTVRDTIATQRQARRKVSFRPSYVARLEGNTLSAAVIPVERIQGPVLVIAGDDDALWPSDIMARQIKSRLEQYTHRYDDQLRIYPGAGHPIGVPFGFANATLAHTSLLLGGTGAANEAASEEAWPQVIGFLRDPR